VALYSGHTDEQLVRLLQSSDEVAFTELYDRYWEKMLIRANMQLQSPEDAEEIVQDIFIRLWRRRGSIDIRHTFHTYIASILKYECYRLLAEKKARKLVTQYGDLPEKMDHSTEQWLDYESLRAELERTVQQLPEKCRIVFRLSREQGLTEKQIAENLQLSPKTIQTQMYRALKKLKTRLHECVAALSLKNIPGSCKV
jgi:RNA polymerase sigma-70 factor (ECF subfamily)